MEKNVDPSNLDPKSRAVHIDTVLDLSSEESAEAAQKAKVRLKSPRESVLARAGVTGVKAETADRAASHTARATGFKELRQHVGREQIEADAARIHGNRDVHASIINAVKAAKKR